MSRRGSAGVVGLVALAALLVPACSAVTQGEVAASAAARATTGPASAATTSPEAGAGSSVGAVSDALEVSAHGMRLVRTDPAGLALQFEMTNDGEDPFTPSDLGLDPLTHVIAYVADLPRGTGYSPLATVEANPDIDFAQPGNRQASASTDKPIPAGGTATVTIVFAAPPAETTHMTVFVDGFVPVDVPVQPAGSPALRDDPVLHLASKPLDEINPEVAPLVCAAATGGGTAAQPSTTTVQLPSDVLFAFGKADLSRASAAALDGFAKQITATGGTITVQGHTDSIGDDASNQALSERRAATVVTALQSRLGSGFTFKAVGFGEKQPIAPNTNPDGSDNPDGRARNRRVVVVEAEVAAVATPQAQPRSEPPNTSLSKTGLVPTVRSVTTSSGFALAQVAIHNTGSSGVRLDFLNDPNRNGPDGIRADYGGELSLIASGGGHSTPCAFPPQWWGLVENGSPLFAPGGGDEVPPGATVTTWALFAAPPADQKSVTVGVGGFDEPLQATVAAG